jgi:hypothetical protein
VIIVEVIGNLIAHKVGQGLIKGVALPEPGVAKLLMVTLQITPTSPSLRRKNQQIILRSIFQLFVQLMGPKPKSKTQGYGKTPHDILEWSLD